MVRVAINGLGIMGRELVRVNEIESRNNVERIEIVAFNDLFPAKQLAPLLRHDSVYGAFPGEVKVDGDDVIVNGKRIKGFCERDPNKLVDKLDVDIIYESSGVWTAKPKKEENREILDEYLKTKAGAKRLIYSAPSKLAKKTIVMGVNENMYKEEDIISAASCTTNALAPLVFALFKKFGLYTGLMTTIHAYTQDQRLQDAPHEDIARAYSALLNFVPTTTGAASAIGEVIKELDKKMDGIAVRGPVAVGSLVDLVANLSRETSREEINEVMRKASESYLKGTLEYREGPLVSSMIIGSFIPSVFDASQTRVVKNIEKGSLVKVLSWYDNVSGYSHQVLKLIRMVGKSLET